MKKILVMIAISLALQGCWETQNGEKIGTLVKVSSEGAIVRTWEAELIRGGMNSGSGSFGKPFYFTIEDKSLLKIAQNALENQKEVRIKYHKEAVTFLRSDSDDYFLDEIKILN